MEDVVLFTLLSFRIKEKNLNITQGYHANIFFFFHSLGEKNIKFHADTGSYYRFFFSKQVTSISFKIMSDPLGERQNAIKWYIYSSGMETLLKFIAWLAKQIAFQLYVVFVICFYKRNEW